MHTVIQATLGRSTLLSSPRLWALGTSPRVTKWGESRRPRDKAEGDELGESGPPCDRPEGDEGEEARA